MQVQHNTDFANDPTASCPQFKMESDEIENPHFSEKQ
jgi:hypothetical protein